MIKKAAGNRQVKSACIICYGYLLIVPLCCLLAVKIVILFHFNHFLIVPLPVIAW